MDCVPQLQPHQEKKQVTPKIQPSVTYISSQAEVNECDCDKSWEPKK